MKKAIFIAFVSMNAHAAFVFSDGFEAQNTHGFADNGFIRPHITSDFHDGQQSYYKEACRYPAYSTEPTMQFYAQAGKRYPIINSNHPLLNPCVLHEDELPPNGEGIIFRAGNQFSFAADNAIDHSWTLTHNLEPAFMSPKLGIPGQSLPVYVPSGEHHAFEFLAEPTQAGGYRAHLIVDASYHYDGINRLGIPFLSIGTWAKKNNHGKPFTHVYRDRHTAPQHSKLTFNAKILSADVIDTATGQWNAPDDTLYGYLQLFIEAEWGGENRVVDIYLTSGTIVDYDFKTYKWNWPIRDSVFDGGSEIVVTSASRLKQLCKDDDILPDTIVLSPGAVESTNPISRDYEIDLNQVFSCLSEAGAFSTPMPASAPITSVIWAAEASGHEQTKASVLWATVEEMKIE